jgi:putative chitinase
MTLKRGSNGPDVRLLQEKLGVPGANGNFGPATEGKLKEWQTANGLDPNGIADPSILRKLGVLSPESSATFNLERLRKHIPDEVLDQIPSTASKFNITTPLRLAHFLSQCGHESGGFKAVRENLNYSETGLKRIFPRYFPGNLNESYARQPEKIANRVYSSRMGNGDEKSGDGFKFRGRGYIQLTGKFNYMAFDKIVEDDIIANPDLVATKYPLMSAAFFFNSNNLWNICDRGAERSIVEAVTRRVNGGLIGIEDRWKHFVEYHNLLK